MTWLCKGMKFPCVPHADSYHASGILSHISAFEDAIRHLTRVVSQHFAIRTISFSAQNLHERLIDLLHCSWYSVRTKVG